MQSEFIIAVLIVDEARYVCFVMLLMCFLMVYLQCFISGVIVSFSVLVLQQRWSVYDVVVVHAQQL